MSGQLVFAALFMLVTGPLLLYNVEKSRRTLRAAQDWQQTRGEVKRSGVSVDGGRTLIHADGGYKRSQYRTVVEYRYRVGGQDYQGHRLTLLDARSNQSAEHFAQAARYPQGAEVTVFYDPARPEQSLLERSLSTARGASCMFYAVGILFTLLGLAMTLFWWLSSLPPVP